MDDHRPMRLGPAGGHEAHQGVQGQHPARPRDADLDQGSRLPSVDAGGAAQMPAVRVAASGLAVRSAGESDGEAGLGDRGGLVRVIDLPL
jgi:hypothetical protein